MKINLLILSLLTATSLSADEVAEPLILPAATPEDILAKAAQIPESELENMAHANSMDVLVKEKMYHTAAQNSDNPKAAEEALANLMGLWKKLIMSDSPIAIKGSNPEEVIKLAKEAKNNPENTHKFINLKIKDFINAYEEYLKELSSSGLDTMQASTGRAEYAAAKKAQEEMSEQLAREQIAKAQSVVENASPADPIVEAALAPVVGPAQHPMDEHNAEVAPAPAEHIAEEDHPVPDRAEHNTAIVVAPAHQAEAIVAPKPESAPLATTEAKLTARPAAAPQATQKTVRAAKTAVTTPVTQKPARGAKTAAINVNERRPRWNSSTKIDK